MIALLIIQIFPANVSALQESSFNYEIINEQVTITAYTGSEQQVIIPDLLAGYPVGAIAAQAFLNSATLQKITLPATVTTIGDSAFSGCTSLEAVCFSGDAPQMGQTVFQGCSLLNTVYYVAGKSGFSGTWYGLNACTYSPEGYDVKFLAKDGTTVLYTQKVQLLDRVSQPADPALSGYNFFGWFKDSQLIHTWDFANNKITANTTIYSSWIRINNDGMPSTGQANLKVVDISQYNDSINSQSDNINFSLLKTQVDAVYIRAISHNGNGPYIDYQAANYATAAGQADLKYGFYYFFYPRATPAESAQLANFFYHFISQYPFQCIPVLDVEETNGLTNDQVNASVEAFAQEFKRISGLDLMIYSGSYFSNTHLSPLLGKYRFWIANWYVTAPTRSLIWQSWDMWQYSSRGVVAGIPNSPIDLDVATENILLKTVSYNHADGTAASSKLASYNSTIPAPPAPSRSGYVFVGWYKSDHYSMPWDFASDRITANTTLYARWLKTPVSGLDAASISDSSIKLTWAGSAGANYYEIYRSTSAAGTYSLVQTLSASNYSFTHTGLIPGKTYYYKIRACASIGSVTKYSDFSAIDSAIPVPAAPSGWKAASTSYQSVRLSWNAVAGANGYVVYRASSAAGTYSPVATTTATSVSQAGLVTGRTYYYKVRAFRNLSAGRLYGKLTAAAPVAPVPAIPARFYVTRASATSLKISWASVSGASGYEIYRATTLSGTYSLIQTTARTYFTNTRLITGKSYCYKVRAYRLVGTRKIYGPFTSVKYARP